MSNSSDFYYLASPYSHPNSFIRELRYQLVVYAEALLTMKGYMIKGPINMCHQMSLRYGLPTGYTYWKSRDRGLIEQCKGVIVLKLDGWRLSEGVSDEIQYAYTLNKEIIYISPKDIFPPEALQFFNFRE